MLALPQQQRQQIAATGLMCSKVLKEIFEMQNEEKADERLIKLAELATGNKEDLLMPWLTVAPLLKENIAISMFVAQNPDWKMMLPEVLSIHEALEIAKGDYLLNQSQTEYLESALQKSL